jgi:hypothetical protein
MRTSTVLLCGTLLLVGCKQGQPADSNAAANVAAPAKPKVKHYCFFAKEAQKAWSASRDGAGNVVVTGKARVDDVRNKADLGQPEVSGSSAKLWLTMAQNISYPAKDNWWDVSFTIPDSAAVDEVTVNCDPQRVLADLKVKPRK